MVDSKFASFVANIATAVLATVVTVAVIKTALVPSSPPQTQTDGAKVGQKIDLPFLKAGQGDTVILALHVGCVYCARSGPLYKTILNVAQAKRRRVIAVLPDPVEQSKSFLTSLGVTVPDVYQVPLSAMHVHGTPTMLLVTDGGIIKRLWVGLQPESNNAKILSDLFGSA
jgi:uncharacterized membrane protein